MQRLEGLMRKAIQDYDMIQPGDRICVGVSGGKDSVALTVALGHLRAYLGIPFEVAAVTLDPRFGGVETDYSPLEQLFASQNIPYEIRRTEIGPIPAHCVPNSAGAYCTTQPKSLAATRLPLAITWMMRSKHFI